MKRPPINELLALFKATLAKEGVTTGAGDAAGDSFIDAALIGAGDNSFVSMLAILYPGQPLLVDSKDITAFNNATGEVTLAGPYKGAAGAIPLGVPYKIVTFRFVPAEVAAIAAALGNVGADMSVITQSEAASVAAYLKNFRSHSRIHNQARICLIVPDLADLVLAGDPQNTAIKAELDKIGTVSLLDQTGVDAGEEDWDVYNLVVVGSNVHATAFVMANLDDLIAYHGAIMVCNSAVAAHLLMGVAAAQTAADTNVCCETIDNRVMQLVFESLGNKVLFDPAQVSDRLNMAAGSLTEHVLMVDTVGDGNTLVVVGWLPGESADAESYELSDGSSIPSGRLFCGCFLHADHLTDTGKLLLRRIARNLTQAHVHPLTVNVKRSYQEDIPDTDVTDTATITEAECILLELGPKNGRRYCLRNLRLKAQADPTPNTMTVRLYEYFHDALVEMASFDIDTTNWGTYYSLMDMFDIPDVHSDAIKVTCEMDAGAGIAVKATYSYAEAKK
ncbi:hypothetical protein ES708_24395 [subsurface metagenome]